MSKLFIDANVLIEILMNRSKSAACKHYLQVTEARLSISVLTVHIAWYLAEKYRLPKDQVQKILNVWLLEPITKSTILLAKERYKGKDFEDCLQAACAELGGCDEIITLDKKFAKDSGTKLPVHVIA